MSATVVVIAGAVGVLSPVWVLAVPTTWTPSCSAAGILRTRIHAFLFPFVQVASIVVQEVSPEARVFEKIAPVEEVPLIAE